MAEALPLLVRRVDAPKCLSRDCIELVQNTLSTGLTERLARRGWSRERTQHDQATVAGRLWQRHGQEVRSLSFSKSLMRWLIWMTADNVAEPQQKMAIRTSHVTTGDLVLALEGMMVLNHTLCIGSLLKQPWLASHGLFALLYPETWATLRISHQVDLARWAGGDGTMVTEAFGHLATQRWIDIERQKRQSADLAFISQVSTAQQYVLATFLDEVEHSGRWDLTRWMLVAARGVLRDVPEEGHYFPRLRTAGMRMQQRSMLYEQGLVLFRSLDRLRAHHTQTQAVGFYDADYQTSQLWKSDWERLRGTELCRRGRELISRNLPLKLAEA